MDELYSRRALWTYARKPGVLGGAAGAGDRTSCSSAPSSSSSRPARPCFREGAPRRRDVYLVRQRLPARRTPGRGPRRAASACSSTSAKATSSARSALLWASERHPFSVQASSRAEVIRIPGAHLFQVLGSYPQARDGARRQARSRSERVARATTRLTPAPRRPDGGKHGAAHASWRCRAERARREGPRAGHARCSSSTRTRCVNCQNCVDACGRRHGHSRLQLRGLQVENFLFPTACRHCDDPVCLLCSVNGIVRLPSGEITIVEDNCIGCGACAERCPYGNISMHAGRTSRRRASSSALPRLARRTGTRRRRSPS